MSAKTETVFTKPVRNKQPSAAAGMLMTIIERYVKQVPNRTRREMALARAFDAYPEGRAKLEEAVSGYQALPLSKRIAAVGRSYATLDINTKFDDKTFEDHLKIAFQSDLVSVGNGTFVSRSTALQTPIGMEPFTLPEFKEKDGKTNGNKNSKADRVPADSDKVGNVVLGNSPESQTKGSKGPLYVVEFAGVYCQKESSWDMGSASDEMYSCFSMFLDKTSNSWTKRSAVYDKMDSGDDWKEDPKPCFLYGPAAPPEGNLWINTIMCENDFGNPNDIAKKWHDAATVAACVAKAYGYDVKPKVAEAAANLVNSILGLGDDMMSSDTIQLDAGSLEWWSNQPLKHFKVQLNYHFNTFHTDGDAKYWSFYRVKKV